MRGVILSTRPHVVIIGGGFGGLSAAQALVDITLIDRRNFHLFQPLLYQVATSSLSPGEIAAPLRGVLSKQKNARVLLGDVVDVNLNTNAILLADGAIVQYDFLIVAAGAQSSYYGHEEWRQWAPYPKSIEEATEIRHKILYAFEVAERISDPVSRASWLTFVIVGGGATCVELAGAIGEIARQTLRNDFRSIVQFQSRVLVFIQWAFQDLTFSRGARMITGTTTTDFNFNKEIAAERSQPNAEITQPAGNAQR